MTQLRTLEAILQLFLERAAKRRIQFKLAKCQFAVRDIDMLGFTVGGGVRKVDPNKMEIMRKWPLPTKTEDLISFLAFANFIKEFIPDYHAYTQHLRPYVKKGARIAEFAKDKRAQPS